MSLDSSLLRLPPSGYSQCPFWFWNDALDEKEILRQIADFQAHGVDAFVIHPRVGLPRTIGWLSPEMFRYMRLAVEEARRRGMWVILYDEGMYPSGSASGLVVQKNPAHHARGLRSSFVPLDRSEAAARDARLVARGRRKDGTPLWFYDQKVDAIIRGLHYIGEEDSPDLSEDEPPAADLLNPASVQSLIEIVYERFFAELGDYFGSTIQAIFTDEPHPLGRCRESGVIPGTYDILDHVNTILGYDFTGHLPALWFDDEPEAASYRRDYARAIAIRLDQTYYGPLSKWCEEHGISLTGHPAEPDGIGHLRHLHIPGQDIVWRHIEPFQPSALEGPPSTMAKAAASSAFHHYRARNLNEFAGAYGPSLTFTELQWLASWLLIRGCNMLVPHAFYYSMRGPRKDERPPDVGPHSPWWGEYLDWADFTRRVCWLNAACQPVCEVAILGRRDSLPWKSARELYEHQIDFHYVYEDDLAGAVLRDGALEVGPGRYTTLLIEDGYSLATDLPGIAVDWAPGKWTEIQRRVRPSVALDAPAPDLRARLLSTGSDRVLLLFNEGSADIARTIHFPPHQALRHIDLMTGNILSACGSDIHLPPGGWTAFHLVEKI